MIQTRIRSNDVLLCSLVFAAASTAAASCRHIVVSIASAACIVAWKDRYNIAPAAEWECRSPYMRHVKSCQSNQCIASVHTSRAQHNISLTSSGHPSSISAHNSSPLVNGPTVVLSLLLFSSDKYPDHTRSRFSSFVRSTDRSDQYVSNSLTHPPHGVAAAYSAAPLSVSAFGCTLSVSGIR